MLIAVDYEYLSTVAFDMLVFGEQPSGGRNLNCVS